MLRKISERDSKPEMRQVLLIELCPVLRGSALDPICLRSVVAALFLAPSFVLLGGCAAPSAITKVAKNNAALISHVEAARVIARSAPRQAALLRLSNENQTPSIAYGLSNSEWRDFEALACPLPVDEREEVFTVALVQETARIARLSSDLNALDLGFAGWLKNGNDALLDSGMPTPIAVPNEVKTPSVAALKTAERCTEFLKKFRENPNAGLDLGQTPFIAVQTIQNPVVLDKVGTTNLGTVSSNEGARSQPVSIADLEQTIILRAIASDAATPVATKPTTSPLIQFPARMSVIESALGALDLLALNWANQARVGTLKWLISDADTTRKFENAVDKFAGPGSRVAVVIAEQRLMAIRDSVTAFAATIPDYPAPIVPTSSVRATRVAALERLRAIHDLRNALETWDIAISVDSDDIASKLKKSREAIGKSVETSPEGIEAVLDQVEQVFKRMRAIERPITTGLTTLGK